MAKLARRNGSTSHILRVKILDSTSTVGAGLTGLTSASSGLRISTIANSEATATAYTVAGSTIESITTLGTFAAPTATKCRFKEVDATNHPGLYELQIADARFAVASSRSVIVSLSGATNMASVDLELDQKLEVGVDGIDRAALAADTGLQSLRSGTAQAGAASTLTLDAGASAVDDFYDGSVLLTGGTGAGQFRDLTGYVGSTKVATVAPAWATVPDSTTTFALFPGAATTAEIADAVWDELLSGHVISGSTAAGVSLLITASSALSAAVAALNNLSAAQVNAEVLDVLTVDTFAEPGQGAPAATATLAAKVGMLHKFLRNRITQDATTLKVYADDGTTVDQKATVSDSGTVYDRGEIGTGP